MPNHAPPLFKRLTLFFFALILFFLLVAAWTASWMTPSPLSPSGGIWWPKRQVLDTPHFAQANPAWASAKLGKTDSSLGAEGCAVTSAAMVLASYGADTDPGRLNAFLSNHPEGYTEQGWIYWETAPLFDPALSETILPHYEDLPSYALLDLNLVRGNPSIVRLRYPGGTTHFVVIVGKDGFDYLIRDPGTGFSRGVYPLRDFGSEIEALRFYQPTTK